MRFLADWFIHGDFEWDSLQEQLRKWGPVIAGGLFGAAWWIWADALVHEHVSQAGAPPFKYNWPGLIATIALVLINLVSRDDLAEISNSGEDGADARARLWLLFSLLLAFGAVAGSVAVLLSCSQAQLHVAVGVGSVTQCGLILASALMLWAFRSESASGGYGYI